MELFTTYHNSTAFEIEERVAWSGAWVVVFAELLLLMKKEYRRTFFATMRGKQQVMNRFSADDEAVKASVLKKNKKMWCGRRYGRM